MSNAGKSPLMVARAAYRAERAALPMYAHKFSRHDFTCAQLFAVLVMRTYLRMDYLRDLDTATRIAAERAG